MPLDYKLTADEHLAAAGAFECRRADRRNIRSGARLSAGAGSSRRATLKTIFVTDAPANADLAGATRWEELHAADAQPPEFRPRQRSDVATHRLFLGDRRAAQGLRDDARKLSGAMRGVDVAVSVCARHALSEYYPDQSCDRFHGADFSGRSFAARAVVHLRTLRPEFIREAFTRYKITYMSAGAAGLEESASAACSERFDALPPGKRQHIERTGCGEQ